MKYIKTYESSTDFDYGELYNSLYNYSRTIGKNVLAICKKLNYDCNIDYYEFSDEQYSFELEYLK
jgi:hypothetical protein